jgi:hypothetical protein
VIDMSLTRRAALRSLFAGSLLMPAVFSDLLGADRAPADPLAPRPPHFPAKAKRVIFIFLTGGFSHIDSFCHRPKLFEEAGKKIADRRFLKRPDWEFKPRGQSGTMVSELFPHLAGVADDLCVVNSLFSEHGNHFEATLGMHTGSVTFSRPSIGSWVSYGLGTENRNLPSFMVLAPHLPYAGGQTWDSNFLPACHQGTRLIPGEEPIANLNRALPSAGMQDLELGLIRSFNDRHLKGREGDPLLAARIRSFETAAGMQQEAPAAFDLGGESDATHELYGLKRGEKKGFAWQALVARRLAERGVRFIELIDSGSNHNWDAHGNMKEHGPMAKNVDQPIAALIKDLKSRGMLDETLIVCTSEFGRTPYVENADNKGREHHPKCFSSWLAGGGSKPGISYGVPDDHGIEVADKKVHLHDFHATILHLLGFDHERLTHRHAGRDFRLTDVHGNVVHDLIA